MQQNYLVGENIKRWRSFKGFKQEHLAEKIGISRVTLSKYENGRTPISFVQLQHIADTLNIQLEVLIAAR
jgi:transcriptional regulator with XRE-family HTH domain